MKQTTEKDKGDGTNKASRVARETPDAVPGLFPFFPFSSLFLFAIFAPASAEKGSPDAAPEK